MLNYSNVYSGQNLLVISYSAPNLNQRFSFSFYEFIEGAGLFTLVYILWTINNQKKQIKQVNWNSIKGTRNKNSSFLGALAKVFLVLK